MNWTYDWLLDYLDTKETARGIADKLTGIGLEVENLSAPSEPVAAKIVECSDIPDTHLHLLKVDDGKDIRQVVCGAPNCRVGLVSALARPGCVVGGVEIKVGKIKGFESDGMMCSEKELGAGDDHGGIMELKNAKLGEPWNGEKASDANAVFDAKVLANRPDYLAVRGIARDLSATGIGKFIASRIPVIPAKAGTESRIPNPESRKIVIKNPERCPTYNFVEIRGIKIAPSCDKIASRLSAIGINPKNAPVDATNYVCFDIGQPMHCFDADEIKGDIIIRNAKDGEKFTDLFDAEHILSADDLVITDADGILALAGVMGGKRGMTTDKTENIILESAYFEPLGIRKTRRRLGLSTDSSYRFERGIDPTMTTQALALASEIIMKECGGKISAASCVRAEFTGPKIKYDPKFFKRRIGFDVDEKTQKEILEKLGYEITVDRELWTVSCPPWRVDDAIAEKLTSDIVRICGYDRIADMNISPSPKMVDIKPVCEENDFFAKTRRLV
ncbi:MAG: phenylalanine--tRNA ligase subunit beta [Rickettsiales bacterium]|jgi:phenylalanyl-tRNA synthetase beta chain|nr:phenylalanine--tRNA ligase subunit beta [Rickettsiales bacterium]